MFERITDGRTDLVFEMIAQGQPATASDDNGVSLLAWCAYYGDVSAMRLLLAHGAALSSLGDTSTSTAPPSTAIGGSASS